jgi:hypothetical protein
MTSAPQSQIKVVGLKYGEEATAEMEDFVIDEGYIKDVSA